VSNGFNPVPSSEAPPPTMTVKSPERCDACQCKMDVFPDDEREMERLVLWDRWMAFIVRSEVAEYLASRAEYERM